MHDLLEKKDFLWVEKYRPQTIAECILPKRLKSIFQEYVTRKEIPVLLLEGTAGVGKTTVAKALCKEVDCDYLFINGSDESGIDTFRMKIKQYASTLSMAGGRKVIIIDEADYLNPNSTQPALRSAIEEFSKNCTFIFTCNYKSKIIEPLQSRCAVINFSLEPTEKKEMALEFFNRIKTILVTENIKADMNAVAKLISKFFPDYRRILNELQRYSIKGEIDDGILSNIKDVELEKLVTAFKAKDFATVRKWAAHNSTDVSQVYTTLYKGLYTELKPQFIPMMIVYLADYQYKSAFVADQELNLIACLSQIMLECEFQ